MDRRDVGNPRRVEQKSYGNPGLKRQRATLSSTDADAIIKDLSAIQIDCNLQYSNGLIGLGNLAGEIGQVDFDAGLKPKTKPRRASDRPAMPEPPPPHIQPVPIRWPETLYVLIRVQEIEEKGMGVVATRDIPAGTILLSELPLLFLNEGVARESHFNKLIAQFTIDERARWNALHVYNSHDWPIDWARFNTNAFEIDKDASAVFETGSRFNHSCYANSKWSWNKKTGRMVYWNRRDLKKGEEITVEYGVGPNHLLWTYGFECNCGYCVEDSGSDSDGEDGAWLRWRQRVSDARLRRGLDD